MKTNNLEMNRKARNELDQANADVAKVLAAITMLVFAAVTLGPGSSVMGLIASIAFFVAGSMFCDRHLRHFINIKYGDQVDV